MCTTFKGKGLISDHHPLGCGVLGRSGTPIASWFMNEADLLFVIGASFSNHTGISADKIPTMHLDFDPMALGKHDAMEGMLYGEIGRTVSLLTEAIGDAPASLDAKMADQVVERWRIWREEKASRRRDDEAGGISAAHLFDSLTRLIPKDAIIPVDVGNNTYSFGRYFEVAEQAVLMSGYLGSIGFALPAAMGAWAATQETDAGNRHRGRKVVSISGDGGLGQYLADFTTWVKYDMNITHVVMNNGELGKISKEQRAGHWLVWQTSLHNPSFAQFAENAGGLGIRVEKVEELDAAIERALAHQGPALVEVMTDALLV